MTQGRATGGEDNHVGDTYHVDLLQLLFAIDTYFCPLEFANQENRKGRTDIFIPQMIQHLGGQAWMEMLDATRYAYDEPLAAKFL